MGAKTDPLSEEVSRGVLVFDREDDADDRDLILVVDIPGEEARNAIVYEMPEGEADVTVADKNTDEYSPFDPVAEVVYLSSLDRVLEDWSRDEVLEMFDEGTLSDTGVRTYTFPIPRLVPATE